MGMSVCHGALANNPQDADSVDNPKENLSFSNTAVARLQLLCFCYHLRKEKTFVIFGRCVMTSSETAKMFRVSFDLSSCQNLGVISGNQTSNLTNCIRTSSMEKKVILRL